MALLSRDMIREIQGIADRYSEREAARLVRADAAARSAPTRSVPDEAATRAR